MRDFQYDGHLATCLGGSECGIRTTQKRGHFAAWKGTEPQISVAPLMWGILNIDVFVKHWDMKCKSFCSRVGSDPTLLRDGLVILWEGEFLYFFPPLSLLSEMIVNLQEERPEAILITPWWPWQLWFSSLFYLAKEYRFHFQLWDSLLIATQDFLLPHNMPTSSWWPDLLFKIKSQSRDGSPKLQEGI